MQCPLLSASCHLLRPCARFHMQLNLSYAAQYSYEVRKAADDEHLTLIARVMIREFFAGLLSRHVLGVAAGPVRICFADGLFGLGESGNCTTKRACQVAYGVEESRASSETPGEPDHDLLHVPAIAVGIIE